MSGYYTWMPILATLRDCGYSVVRPSDRLGKQASSPSAIMEAMLQKSVKDSLSNLHPAGLQLLRAAILLPTGAPILASAVKELWLACTAALHLVFWVLSSSPDFSTCRPVSLQTHKHRGSASMIVCKRTENHSGSELQTCQEQQHGNRPPQKGGRYSASVVRRGVGCATIKL